MSPECGRASFSWAGHRRTVRTLGVDAQCTGLSSARQPAIEQPSSSHPANRVGRQSPCFPFLPRPCHAVLSQVARHGSTKPHAHRDRAKETSCTQCMCPVWQSWCVFCQHRSLHVVPGQGMEMEGATCLPAMSCLSFPLRPSPSIQHYPSVASINRQLFQTSSHRILNLNLNIASPSPSPSPSSSSCRPPPSTHRPPSIAGPLHPHTSDLRSIRFPPLGPRPWCDFILHPTEPRFSRLRPSWHGLCSSTATASALNHPGSM